MNLIEYLLNEVKAKRLAKPDAVHLLSKWNRHSDNDASVLHPLLHVNTSMLNEQRFSSNMSGEEFFLRDHVIQGQRVLPGVCYLEMARAAVAESVRGQEVSSICLTNIVWSQPFAAQGDKALHIGLEASEHGEIEYEIYTVAAPGVASDEREVEADGVVIHALGRAQLITRLSEERLDIAALRQGCERRIEREACYAAFAALGIEYGSAQRGVDSLSLGTDGEGRRYVLGEVKLPDEVRAEAHRYVLHPSVLDSALQVGIGLALDRDRAADTKPFVPFALERLEIVDRSPSEAWVYVRASRDQHEKIQKLDIDLCDASGRVCVRMRGFAARVLERSARAPQTPALLGELPIGSKQEGAVEFAIESSAATLTEKTIDYLKKRLATVLKLPVEELDAAEGFEQYGIDSILALQLTTELEDTFGALSKALLFEYQSIEALAGFFIEQHAELLKKLLSVRPDAAVKKGAPPESTAMRASSEPDRRRHRGPWMPTAQSKPTSDTAAASEVTDIAIVGIGGRYPKARNVEELWENLKAGRDCITEIPPERWDYRQFFDPEKGKIGKSYSKWGGFIDGIEEFDPLFFNISPREAPAIDPQERLFLQCAYETLEDAGYTSNRASGLGGSVGVFVGVMYEEYQFYGVRAQAVSQPYALSGSASSIANRVSYFCNFHGPSMAVDTMCSSSLTAIHLACESLKRAECAMAIAGGVNVSIHANKYLMLTQAQFAASDGRCRSFGAGGDGYVPGEGAGAILLKPLARARADRDHIYGVIKATSINHGGKATAYTVPNPQAQARVIAEALKNARIHPRTISYVEAHGTGTALGDPIEVTGLSKAFNEYTQERQFCAIGSAKSNIGHLESAAGIAGITKVLLQLKHGLLVPSLHAEVLNPHIDFEATPFHVQRSLSEWVRPVLQLAGQERKQYPRIACASSFGAGGSNACVIIEEYLVPQSTLIDSVAPTPEHPALIVLSAKNEEQLKARASRLLAYFESSVVEELDLMDVAYTLQVGREAMEWRLALTVTTIEELQEKLRVYLSGKAQTGEGDGCCYVGDSRKNKDALSFFNTDEVMQQAINTWMERGQYAKLLDLWVKGLPLDWSDLYRGGSNYGSMRPKRIALPTYPFAREKYWIESNSNLGELAADRMGTLHPLLHANTSELSEQRFSSRMSGEEFFLRDHVIQGQKVLPGVCYLEMARAAVAESVRGQEASSICLTNVVWSQPFLAAKISELHIALEASESDEIEFEIYTVASQGAASDERAVEADGVVVHAQGRAQLTPRPSEERLDLAALRQGCDRRIEREACYAAFTALGIEYGPAHRGVASLSVGTGGAGRRYVLGEVKLPDEVRAEAHRYVLHPSVMDSALQVAMGLALDQEESLDARPRVPFALEQVEIIDRSPSEAWVCVRACSDQAAKIQKLDIDLCDTSGRICVRMKGFAARSVERDAPASPVQDRLQNPRELPLLLTQGWQAAPRRAGEPQSERSGRVVWLPPIYKEWVPVLQAKVDAQIELLDVGDLAVELDFPPDIGSLVKQVFATVQSILLGKPQKAVLLQVVVPHPEKTEAGAFIAAIGGLLKSARLENPRLQGQVIEAPSELSADELIRLLEENASDAASQEQMIRYREGAREVARLLEVSMPTPAASNQAVNTQSLPWKDKGVYLITGGAGGLGLIVAREIVQRVQSARIILVGRSSLNTEQQVQVDALSDNGARTEYRQLNVTDADDVQRCIAHIVNQHGALDGVIHSAGVVRDNFIVKKTVEELQDVLAPKIAGTLQLDRATAHLHLDFFILFSSLSATFGNVGQSDYACANAWLDAYASFRNTLARQQRRHGKTLSINWPLWAEGGMQVDAATLGLMRQRGFDVLSTAHGIDALYEAWRLNESQVLVVAGNAVSLRSRLLPELRSTPVGASATTRLQDGSNESHLASKVQRVLVHMVADLLKMKPDDVDCNAELGAFGFDSISLTELARNLNRAYGLELSPTAFFEYPTVNNLAEYLAKEHREAFGNSPSSQNSTVPVLSIQDAAANSAAPNQVRQDRRPTAKPFKGRRQRSVDSIVAAQSGANVEPIAIVGMSGCFPGARSVDELWENLRAGKDCITEVPASRWDWRSIRSSVAPQTDKTSLRWGGFLDEMDEFDPLFFSISPREAEFMDPQQRLLMTHIWRVIEDAGYSAQSLSGSRTGIFVGMTGLNGYTELIARANISFEDLSPTAIVGSVGPSRMSYFLNLHGPSEPIETACSSSLVAIHRAVRAMQCGDCDMALVGGVNAMPTASGHISLGMAGMLSEDGRCKTFSKSANGYVRGEGVGMLFLKKLSTAERDGDHIYAVIKGSSENHGGRANSLTSPNPKAQAELIKAAYLEARIDPRTVSYIEAHGTGTPFGDPIEINGLRTAFKDLYEISGDRSSEVKATHCGVGSLKSNIGHLEWAAGAAGVIKVLLQLKHKTLVQSLHCEEINPHIQLDGSPFYLVRETQPWATSYDAEGRELPRRAGVSAFGFGGVNAHVVVEEYIRAPSTERPECTPEHPALIVLSAKSTERLHERVALLLVHLQQQSYRECELLDVAYTLQLGRETMECRLAFTASTIDEVQQKLQRALDGRGAADLYRGELKTHREALAALNVDDDTDALIDRWLAKGKYAKLLDLWTKGLSFDWSRLYGSGSSYCPVVPQRIALPTYPFARDKYWIESKVKLNVIATVDRFAARSPLPHANTSSLNEQRLGSKASSSTVQRELAKDANASVHHEIENYLARLLTVALALTRDQVAFDKSLQDYGVDSIIALKLLRSIEADFAVKISGREMLEFATIGDLATHLSAKLREIQTAEPIASDVEETRLNQNVHAIDTQGKEIDAQTGTGARRGELPRMPMSEGQKGLWVIQVLDPSMSSYNVPLCLRLQGTLQLDAMQAACGFLLKQHPLLAAAIEADRGIPYMVNRNPEGVPMRALDVREMDDDAVLEHLKKEAKRPFVLEEALFRITALSRSSDEHFLLIVAHHIVCDGYSVPLLLETLFSAYDVFCKGEQPPLRPMAASYAEFVAWEERMLAGKDAESHRTYWMRQLGGALSAMELHTDYARHPARSIAGQTYTRTISDSLAGRIRSFCAERRVSAAALFLSTFKILLHRYSDETDIIVGMPTLGRPQDCYDALIGYFVNLVALRDTIDDSQSFTDTLRAVHLTLVDALDHASYPFPRIVRDLNLSGARRDAPIFQVAFVFQNSAVLDFKRAPSLGTSAVSIAAVAGIGQEGEYELALEVVDQTDRFNLNLKYDAELYRCGTIARMVEQLEILLESAIARPELEIGALPLLDATELQRVVVEFNSTPSDSAADRLIHELFEEQVERTPDEIAVVHEGEQLTYRELNRQANQLAHCLRDKGVGPDRLVAICMDRSVDMVVSVLGVLKAGGAYLPLDPSYPQDRLEYIVKDAQPQMVLAQSHTKMKLLESSSPVLALDSECDEIARCIDQNFDSEQSGLTPKNLAYVIYTSGSTGQPKGALVEHRNVVNLWRGLESAVYARHEDCRRVAMNASLSFDASVQQLVQLLSGRTLILVPQAVRLDPASLGEFIAHERIDSFDCTPSQLAALMSAGSLTRGNRVPQIALVGGEAIDSSLWRTLSSLSTTTFYNVYGPTECTVDTTVAMIESSHEAPHIGRPLANTQIYILDHRRQPVPIGLPGEIHIGGAGVGRGYLNRPELDTQRFVANPFANDSTARMYKSGDFGCWRADGTIEYLGRNDHQVKVRGYRIELEEIEAQLLRNSNVKNAVVVVREESPGDKRLIAYLTHVGVAPEVEDLRAALQAALPEYMIPSAYVMMDGLPLTPSGKLDRQALPRPDRPRHDVSENDAPQSRLEKSLASIWSEVLNVECLGRNDNFFELGGHSMSAVRLIAQIETDLNIRVPLAELFRNRTIAELAATIERMQGRLLRVDRGSMPIDSSRVPLFLVHPIGGHGLAYRQLADGVQNFAKVHLLQRPELGGQNEILFLSVEQLCDAYANEILAVDEDGPVYLCGWSLGAILALHLAVKLESLGKQVAYLGLLDCVPPSDRPLEFAQNFAELAGVDVAQELKRWPNQMLHQIKQLWLQNPASRIEMRPVEAKDADRFFHLFVANLWLGQVMGLPKEKLRSRNVCIYGASESLAGADMLAVQLQMQRLFHEPVQFTQYATDHFGIMDHPIVGEVARRLEQDVRRAAQVEAPEYREELPAIAVNYHASEHVRL